MTLESLMSKIGRRRKVPEAVPPAPVDPRLAGELDAVHGQLCDGWQRYEGRQGAGKIAEGQAMLFYARAQGVETAARILGITLSRPTVHQQAGLLRIAAAKRKRR